MMFLLQTVRNHKSLHGSKKNQGGEHPRDCRKMAWNSAINENRVYPSVRSINPAG